MDVRVGVMAVIAVCVGACGGGGGGGADAAAVDAGIDGPTPCTLPPGPTHILSNLDILPSDQGFDLDGDDTIDNEFGKLPNLARNELNKSLDSSMATGEFILLLHYVDWAVPPTPSDDDLSLWVLTGDDGEMPPMPENNFAGGAPFYVKLTQFDLSCLPETTTSECLLVDGRLRARAEVWDFPLSTSTGSATFTKPVIDGQFDAEFRTMNGRIGTVLTMCTLSAIPAPGFSGTLLDVLVNEPTISQLLAPDMDLDGDGLERANGDGVTVVSCTDGEGNVIEGVECPCHPDIRDGYSAAFDYTTVWVTILGLVP